MYSIYLKELSLKLTYFITDLLTLYSMSQGEKKKKSYKKAPKVEISMSMSNMESSFGQKSITFDKEISQIHPFSHSSTEGSINHSLKQQLSMNSNMKKKKDPQIENLHHDDNFFDLKSQFQDKEILKNLKKYIKKAFPAKSIELFCGHKSPSLKFQYLDTVRDNQLRIRSLGDLLTANKELGSRQYETVQKIFDQLYCRLNEKQKKIVGFLKILAEKKRVQLQFIDPKRKIPLLYYEYDEKQIAFTLFDKEMRILEFSSEVINQFKFDPEELKLWYSFIKTLEDKRVTNEKRFDQYGEHEVSSDEEKHYKHKKINEKELGEINNRINQLKKTDLTQFQQDLEQLDLQCNQLYKKNDDRDKQELERLADQVSELHHNIDNFKQAVEQVELALKKGHMDLNKLKNLLKILIIAQKQLKSRLPIVSRKTEIKSLLDKNDLIILEGQTGSGKSTQLPQIMCEYLGMFKDNSEKILPVLITQPRRLATRTVAERVAYQMEESIGGFVDYATSSHKQVSKTAKIVFKLDSVVLDELTKDRQLRNYSCLIIDQAHERTISIDVILGLIKELQVCRKGFKVIVTSASLDAKLFSDYFKTKVFKVSGRLYPVQILFRPVSHQSDLVKKIESVIKKQILVSPSELREEYKGDILVFCSGVQEINILCSIFDRYLNQRVFRVYALHGRIAVAEQRQVFLETKEYKIIFASRIAETSITINRVKVVVDPGVDRELVYDQRYRVSSRKLINISQSSAKQRAGRAGRTSRGFCFRLYSENELGKFRINKTPQIDNMALDTLVLRLKSLGVDNIFTFPYVKIPDQKALEQSVQTLQMIGGLSDSKEITTVGKLLLQLQVEPFLGRSIVQGLICDYIVRQTKFLEHEDCFKTWEKKQIELLRSVKANVIEILCMVINSSNLFNGNINLRQRIDQIKYTQFANVKGDFFYLSNIYNQFYHRHKDSKQNLNQWLNSNYLSKKILFQTHQLIQQINEIIKHFKLDTKDKSIIYLIDTIKLKLTHCRNTDDVIMSCMVTSFCVNLCLYSNNAKVGYTLVLQKKPVIIYGTSTIAQQGLTPKWIVCYDLKTNDKGTTYCTIAHQVNFDFLRKTVQNFVFKRLNLKQAETMNPFYVQIDRQLPTSVLSQIQSEYLDKDCHNIVILRHITIDINDQTNTLSIFYSRNLKTSDVFGSADNQIGLDVKDLVVDYIQQKIMAKKNSKFRCNVVSNIFAQFKDGFVVKEIHFTDLQVEFVVKGENFMLIQMRNMFQGLNTSTFGDILKVITFNEADEKRVKALLEKYGLTYDEARRNKKEQTLMGRIYMKFYIGRLKKEPLFLYYGRNSGQRCRDMCSILQQFKSKEVKVSKNGGQALKYINVLRQCKFIASFKATGIKCYNKNVDAFELKEAIDHLIVVGLLPFNFQKPHGIREFRDVESSALAMRSDKEWQEEITKMLTQNNLSGLTASVKGQKRDEDDSEQRNAERLVKDQLTAVITSKSLQTIDDMVRKLDGREGVLGLGKIHFRYNFKQLIVKVHKHAFQALSDQFLHIRALHEGKSYVKIEYFQRTFGKATNIFINCRSPIRQNLLEPTEEIRNLFCPYIKRLEVPQFNFLNSTHQGQLEMQKIEEDVSYGLCFGMNKKSHSLKIYCLEQDYQLVDKRIDQVFQKHQVFVQYISYRGKGLAKVEEVLSNLKKQNDYYLNKNKNSKLVLDYSIIFKRREVQIFGDCESLKKARLQIHNINNNMPGSCNLCGKNAEKPFRLTHCQHEFCQKCLADYIKQIKKEEDDQTTIVNSSSNTVVAPLSCPYDNCEKKINSADLQTLLTTQQFQSLSMKRLKDYVSANKEYFFCPTVGCDQIFQLKKIEQRGNFQCMMCGRWFCSSCKQPHQYFGCQQWKIWLEKGELIRFGFKRCVCGYILQKEQKGKLVRCKNCKEYLCWSCDKSWKTEKFCMEHIRVCKK